MCTTYQYTYLNCPHRPSQQIRCSPSDQGQAKCIAETVVVREEGLICSACFESLVWIRSSGEWEEMEEPEGDLGKDDWEKVERVGYDWQEKEKEADVKGRTESKSSNVSRAKSLPR
ncbi:hypothetical protein CJF30_00010056 [Rutstroemia sp. NJR-2017a BBW]|nr:hypothetical protein CJF30_00010056 [Rutstroemia sp. NJR-2017a BBW]